MPYFATMTHRLSPELCWLARILIASGMEGRMKEMDYYQGVAHYSLDPLHALIETLRIR
jgi:hypothetical protein